MCSLLLEEKDWSVAVGGCGQLSLILPILQKLLILSRG